MIRVGVLGAGFMGAIHARAFARLADVQVVGIVDLSLEKAATVAHEMTARALTDPDILIQDPEIDIIDVCLPTPMHREYAVAALEAGKHVLCEKPIASSLAEADDIITAAEGNKRRVMVAHVLRFWPAYVRLHDIVAEGQLGRPLWATAYRLSCLPDWAEWIRSPHLSGGTAIDLMIHDFDYLNWLLGQPRTVSARGIHGGTAGQGHIVALLTYEDGRQAAVEGSQMMPDSFPFTSGIRVVCESGVVEYSFRAGGRGVEMGQAVSSLLVCSSDGTSRFVPVKETDPYEAEVEYFVDCVRTDSPPLLGSAHDSRTALAVALGAREAIETGETVTVA